MPNQPDDLVAIVASCGLTPVQAERVAAELAEMFPQVSDNHIEYALSLDSGGPPSAIYDDREAAFGDAADLDGYVLARVGARTYESTPWVLLP